MTKCFLKDMLFVKDFSKSNNLLKEYYYYYYYFILLLIFVIHSFFFSSSSCPTSSFAAVITIIPFFSPFFFYCIVIISLIKTKQKIIIWLRIDYKHFVHCLHLWHVVKEQRVQLQHSKCQQILLAKFFNRKIKDFTTLSLW